MRSRLLIVVGTLSVALVCGGWFLARVFAAGGTGSGSAWAVRTGRPAGAGAQLFDDVMEHVARDYVDSVANDQIYKKALDGMLYELHDPHTAYLPPDRLRRLTESTTGTYVGLGIQIDIRDGWITIITPVAGSPAERAGIESGDRVVEINGQPTHGWTQDEATAALRGVPGSSVRVTVERPGVEARIPFTLTRQEIHVHAVRHAVVLRPGLGYVDAGVFSDSLARELRHAVDSLRSRGVHTLILDLRNNPGGLLDQGVAVSQLFLDRGQTIVTMRGRAAGTTRQFVADAPARWPDLGVIVLVNGATASAAEIVAGALQDHDRALIVGRPSYGKGSAQSLFKVDGGALKLTTALWYTPAGRSINRPLPRVVDDDGADDSLDVADTTAKRGDTAAAARPLFRTDGGRVVYGGGGIRPDVVVGDTAAVAAELAFQRALGNQLPPFRDALTSYALSLKAAHAVSTPDVVVTPAMREELWQRVQAHHVALDRHAYDAAAPVVTRVLTREIVRYVFGTEGEFRAMVKTDSVIHVAEELAARATSPRDLVLH